MKNRIIIVTVLLAGAFSIYPETQYSLDLTTDLITGFTALGVNIPDFILDSGPSDLNDPDEINFLDRSVMYEYNENMDDISTYASAGLLLLPVLTPLTVSEDMDTWLTYGVMYSEAFLLTHGTKNLLKSTVPRNRPYSYLGDIPDGEEDDYYNSFPSGHTSYAFLGATFLATTLLTDNRESEWTKPLIYTGYSLATAVGVMRVLSGNHYITDVLAGAAIGTLYGWLVPWTHMKMDGKSLFVNSDGSKELSFCINIPL